MKMQPKVPVSVERIRPASAAPRISPMVADYAVKVGAKILEDLVDLACLHARVEAMLKMAKVQQRLSLRDIRTLTELLEREGERLTAEDRSEIVRAICDVARRCRGFGGCEENR